MKIQELFERDIHRPINGVVKADQLDSSSVWQELDEFVVTQELTGHISDLVEVLLSSIESEQQAADRNGIWVSGFFGCGKSHLIKVLSYVLQNEEHFSGDGEHKLAVEFFADKVDDALLFADLKKVADTSTDTILFNVDSKADHSKDRDALLQVFLKVLNEKQGYSGDHPHIANMERHLAEEGKLDEFHAAFAKASGESWLEQRDAYEFHRDFVIDALSTTLGQSKESIEKWVDSGEDNFSLTVENFAKWVKQYLDGQGPEHRLMFLVDEVGQFIGDDTHLMLSLQTITEQLGTVCDGRAWVVVTSQEDLDAVLGDLKQTKQHDFSKIQGRFKTRLSLSSANVDEVIKKRLLAKNTAAPAALAAAYSGKHDILKNQLSFTKTGRTYKTFEDEDDFAACYPFAAYQFNLVQRVFESIRKAGATGLHLSRGERSTLDAFQSAAKQVADEFVGTLVPLYRFYPAVEGFLDTAVKLTIEQAADNHALQPFDSTVLKVLFLIRYIDEMPGTVGNLVTLCVDGIDIDVLALRKDIEESLARLEAETLVARNGDLYFFLTNEERDVGREIKNTSIPSGEEERALGTLIFSDILGDGRKHTFAKTGRDFGFNRICDDHVVGNKLEDSLEVSIISPLGDRYAQFQDDAAGIMDTSAHKERIVVRLPDDPTLGQELRTYLQTEAYVKTKHTGALPETTKRILRDRSEENRGRRKRIEATITAMLAGADYFASGQKLEPQSSDPKAALGEAFDYLIENAYSKMDYIEHLSTNPKQEIQSTLRANDIEQISMELDTPTANPEALKELRSHIELSAAANREIVLHDLIHKRFGGRPFGWPELEVVLLVSRLAVLKEIDLVVNQQPLRLDEAYDHLTSSSKQRRVAIKQKESADGDLIKDARAAGKELFAAQGPSAEEPLFTSLKEKLESWGRDLAQYETLAGTGNYPGFEDIQSSRAVVARFVGETDSLRFLKRFVAEQDELKELADDVQELQGFYKNQKRAWEQLRTAVDALSPNRMQLQADGEAGAALTRMEEILGSSRPYGMLSEVAGLEHTASEANERLVAEARADAADEIQRLTVLLTAELDSDSVEESLRKATLGAMSSFLETANQLNSIPHIAQAESAARSHYETALAEIDEASSKGGDSTDPPPKKRNVVEPRSLTSGFLETQQDVDDFLRALRERLEAAIAADERVQIK